MRILFISQLFDPEYSIKGQVLMEYWISKGHEVEVLTTFPNYPTGKVFDGYKVKLKSVEDINGVKITRLWSHISHSKSKLSRAFSYVSFTMMALIFTLFRKKPDVIYAYHPQSTTGLIGLLMKKLKQVPFVTDVQDLWPDALTATGMNPKSPIIRIIDWWCKVVYKNASQVLVLSKGFRDALILRGVDPEKISIVYNWCSEESLIEKILLERKQSTSNTGPAHFVYAGNMGAAQSLKSIIDAVSSFNKDHVFLTLIGGGVEKNALQEYVSKIKVLNVEIKDYVPSSQIFNVLAAADILIIHLHDDPLFRITIPSKTQSSMAMGKPILMAVGGEANELVKEAMAGETAEPGNVDSIKSAISELLIKRPNWPQMGRNAREYYLKQLSTSSNYLKLDDVLNRAVKKDDN